VFSKIQDLITPFKTLSIPTIMSTCIPFYENISLKPNASKWVEKDLTAMVHIFTSSYSTIKVAVLRTVRSDFEIKDDEARSHSTVI
jgi:hypothetical protein